MKHDGAGPRFPQAGAMSNMGKEPKENNSRERRMNTETQNPGLIFSLVSQTRQLKKPLTRQWIPDPNIGA